MRGCKSSIIIKAGKSAKSKAAEAEEIAAGAASAAEEAKIVEAGETRTEEASAAEEPKRAYNNNERLTRLPLIYEKTKCLHLSNVIFLALLISGYLKKSLKLKAPSYCH